MSQEGTILWALQPDPSRRLFVEEGPTERLIRAIEIIANEMCCGDRPASELLTALELQRQVRGQVFAEHVHEAVNGVIVWLQERKVEHAPPDQAIDLLHVLHDGYRQARIIIEAGTPAHQMALDYLVAVFAPD